MQHEPNAPRHGGLACRSTSAILTVIFSVVFSGTFVAAAGRCPQADDGSTKEKPKAASSGGQTEQVKALRALEKLGASINYTRGVPTSVNLRGRKVTDEDLRHLSQLDTLRGLWLNSTGITDTGLVHIERLQKLHTLYIDTTHIGDAGMIHISKLANLSHLYMSDTNISYRGAKLLTKLEKLTHLDLARTLISEEALPEIAKLSKLEYLNICDTDVNDEGLLQLVNLHRLKTLFAGYTYLRYNKKKGQPGWIPWDERKHRVTQAGLDRLRKKMPGTSIPLDVEEF
ncbi:MAG: hypothetical protein IID44_23735 [Planctomycetes bacterium]|nr:hypothetical protein [Planctomycetota bacterium]